MKPCRPIFGTASNPERFRVINERCQAQLMIIRPNDPIARVLPAGALGPRRWPVVVTLLTAIGYGVAALIMVPRGIEAESILAIENDPPKIVDYGLDQAVNPNVIRREIEAALAINDADLRSEERRVGKGGR